MTEVLLPRPAGKQAQAREGSSGRPGSIGITRTQSNWIEIFARVVGNI